MASFKLMSSSNSRNSDLSRRNSSSASSSPSVRSNHLRHSDHSRITFGYGGVNDVTTLHDYNFAFDPNLMETAIDLDRSNGDRNSVNGGRKSVDDVWKEIVSGEKKTIMKEEAVAQEEDTMTLEDFLAKAASAMDDDDDDSDEIDVKIPPERLSYTTFDYPMMQQHNPFQMTEGSNGGGMRGKRGRVMMVEAAMDKAAAQRQKRMIKNRESAARSRERKQAYQVELETLVAKLEQENEQLLKEIEDKAKERYKNLMEQLIPVDEKPRALSRSFSRSHSLEW
ncbi:hypothetical protein EUTSA_v10009710mg [Eutrema salsugineum]|uniref:BZIP domain-containing protein n=1 Tax=Eutrema salsugineum TaxID=72664 RepID=V4MW79_EUTSA|nr:G-box-binding factor 4 [Eutrema salsugineum]ESQ36536.1 hypothetical protein EUTSA_v10009710mg [Eutrema salsugineum]